MTRRPHASRSSAALLSQPPMNPTPALSSRRLASVFASFLLPAALFAQVESENHKEFPNFDRRADAARANATPGVGNGGANASPVGQAKSARDEALTSLRGRVQ